MLPSVSFFTQVFGIYMQIQFVFFSFAAFTWFLRKAAFSILRFYFGLCLSRDIYFQRLYVSPVSSSASSFVMQVPFHTARRVALLGAVCVHKFARCNSKKKQAWRLDGVQALVLYSFRVCLVAASSSGRLFALCRSRREQSRCVSL